MTRNGDSAVLLDALQGYAAMNEREWRETIEERRELVCQLQEQLVLSPDKPALLAEICSVLVKHGRDNPLSMILVVEIFERAIEHWHLMKNDACEEIVAFLWGLSSDQTWIREDAYALNEDLFATDSIHFG